MAPPKRFKKFQIQVDSGESIEEYLLKRRKRFPSQIKPQQPVIKGDESIIKEENISVQESNKDITNSSTIIEVNTPQEDGQIEGKGKERKKVENSKENKQKEQPKKQERKKAEPRLRKSLLSKLFSEERKTEK